MTSKSTGTSPPLTFISEENGSGSGAGSGSSGAPALALLPRPQQQHQYQQTDKCTVLKLDVLKPQSGLASNSSSSTYLQIEQQLSELEAADEEEENMASLLGSAPPAQILANQPIIVKIEPTQSFHIVDEGDTRVLSLPLSDADKLGASWIDLKDIAGLQAGGGATLLDVCFEQANEEGTIIATVQPDLDHDDLEMEGKDETEEETEPEPPAPKRLATTRPAQSRPHQQQQQPQQQQQQQQVKFLSDPPALARSSSFSSLSSFSSISNISSVCKNMASNASQEGSLKRSKERTPPPLAPQKPAATSTATSATSGTSASATAATSARDNSREHSSSGNGAMTGNSNFKGTRTIFIDNPSLGKSP